MVILEITFLNILRIWQIAEDIGDEEEIYGEDERAGIDVNDTSNNGILVESNIYCGHLASKQVSNTV